MHFETEGFPEPEVKWKREHGESLSDPIQTSKEFHSETGLYNIQSSYTAPNTPFNVTFILENQLLGQYLQRPISYTGKNFPTMLCLCLFGVYNSKIVHLHVDPCTYSKGSKSSHEGKNQLFYVMLSTSQFTH